MIENLLLMLWALEENLEKRSMKERSSEEWPWVARRCLMELAMGAASGATEGVRQLERMQRA
ncbi:hypothetical protein GYH30_050124 [Glycine max]|nr:hypothetical protein GYH30_050124 [Glycine max]